LSGASGLPLGLSFALCDLRHSAAGTRRAIERSPSCDAIEPDQALTATNKGKPQEGVMADKSSLGLLGFIFGGITAIVALIAGFLVIGHVEGKLMLDESSPTAVAASLTTEQR
jgi:hypothetical protein